MSGKKFFGIKTLLDKKKFFESRNLSNNGVPIKFFADFCRLNLNINTKQNNISRFDTIEIDPQIKTI